MKALIENTSVIQVEETEFEVHPSLIWVTCPDNVEVGWEYIDGSFIDNRPSEMSIDDLIAEGQSAEIKLQNLRLERNKKLAETDYYALTDVTLSDTMRTYRQALRDITNTYQNLDDVVWPDKPAS